MWLACHLGKVNEIEKSEDKEIEDVVDPIRSGLFNNSFEESYGMITLARAAPSDGHIL